MTSPTPTGQQQLTPAQLAALLALVQAQAAVRQRLTDTAVAAVLAAFDAIDWWSPAAVKHAITQAMRILQPTQLQAARVTDAYLTRVATVMTGQPHRPAGAVDVTKLRTAIPPPVARDLVAGRVKPAFVALGDTVAGPGPDIQAPARMAVRADTTLSRRPAPRAAARTRPAPAPAAAPDRTAAPIDVSRLIHINPGEPYGRAAEAFRYDVIARGLPEPQARAKALVRVSVAAQTDVTLAVREQWRVNLEGLKPRGYRRILHPERSQHGPCGLCTVAADRIYRVEDLLPIHGNCRCEVLPIFAGMDPGFTLNADDLTALYGAAGSTGGGKRQKGALKRISVALAEHGELGPVLVDADQNWRGPREVAATEHPDRAVRARAQLTALEKSLKRLLDRQAAGEKVDKPLRWQRDAIAQLRAELGDDLRPTVAPLDLVGV